ncbi:hypothetical protein [Methanocella paludicola]|uniref:hypothetical protein n=1 Tax=Methanocella paludicola TaxID=570267 RepID=UPI0010084F81|nr:hypothetical protein [Methanocella paludicola]
MLKKHMSKYETQQKVIEAALENLDNDSKQITGLSEEDELWLQIKNIKSVCAIQRESFKILLETLNIDRYRDHVAEKKPLEFIVEVYYQKPLRECSLVEILDALVVLFKVSNLVDTVQYSDDGDHYTLKMTHDFGFNHSRLLKVLNEGFFRSYGAYADYIVSDRSLFIKIYKIDVNPV